MTIAALLAAGSLLGAEAHTVTAAGRSFTPARVTAVTGDAVTWRNTDTVAHDVRAVDRSFGSGLLGRWGTFTATFDRAGEHAYLCSIHPFMRGRIDVYGALLRAPAGPVLAGESVRLEGRATPGATVMLDDPRAHAVAGPDGAFSFTVTAVEGAVHRALTAAGPSPAVALDVAATVGVEAALTPGRRRARVRVRTVPAAPGLVAVLQRYSRERFMWRALRRARLGAGGRARFSVRTTRRGRVRVVLARAPAGAPLAVSPTLRVRDGRHVADPVRPHAPH